MAARVRSEWAYAKALLHTELGRHRRVGGPSPASDGADESVLSSHARPRFSNDRGLRPLDGEDIYECYVGFRCAKSATPLADATREEQ